MIDGGNHKITRVQYDALLQLNPVYVPGTIGITVREELYREVAQERMILEGRQNQVLRNLVYRLKKKPAEWKEFIGMVQPLFFLGGLDVPFDDSSDEWLTATYKENGCEFDFVSAGSGFLQVINLLSFLFLHTSRVALLDEPDSHMHDDLQRLTFDLLDKLSQKRNIQIVIATHSPTLIDAAGLEHVLLIDRAFKRPLQAQEVEKLVPMLGDRGLALPPAKVMNTLKARRALFVEGKEADFEEFIHACGEICKPGFTTITRGITVFETGGATKQWPFEAIDCFQQLLGVDLKYLYVSDRDFLTDLELAERATKANHDKRSLSQLQRRHRESYLVIPEVLARVIEKKWRTRHADEPIPNGCTAESIKAFILSKAEELEETIRSDLLVEHEQVLRGTHDHRADETRRLNEYFRDAYTKPLAQGEVPYKLLDCKQVLKDFRTRISTDHRLAFSDRDILDCLTRSDLPADLLTTLEQVLSLFPPPKPAISQLPADLPGLF
jgi:predicted ATP-dependent endonuclease of OLD family